MRNSLIEEAALLLLQSNPFYGHLLTCMETQINKSVPTAGVMFDAKLKKIKLVVNPDFFGKLTTKEQVAVLQHELMHITHKHIFTDLSNKSPRERIKLNMAADLVINQFIKFLPNGALLIENFKDDKGLPYPSDKTTEYYLELLEESEMKQEDKGNGDGQGDSQAEDSENDESGNKQGDQNGKWKKVKDMLDAMEKNGQSSAFDEHGWAEGSESDKLDAVKSLVQRAIDKQVHAYGSDQAARDLLEQLKEKIRSLNYKSLLKLALKKSLPSRNRERNWKRLSRRYQEYAKGKSKGRQSKLEVYVDCSGSMSVTEINESLSIIEGFLGAGVDECYVNLFHTSNFHREKLKKGFKLDQDVFQSGGTDLTDSFNVAIKNKPDLCVIITDGHWDTPRVDYKKMPNTLFIISKQGTVTHPLANQYKTVQY